MADEMGGVGISVEVAYAEEERQWLVRLELPEHATVEAALAAFRARLPDLVLPERFAVGIYGQVVARTRRLANSDRVEIYRPLPEDPRATRRRVARAGGTMDKR